MATRSRPAGLSVKASLVIVLLLVLAAALCAPGVAAASSPSPTTEDQPFVNWTWLAIGLGGMLALLVVMFILTRFFGKRREEE